MESLTVQQQLENRLNELQKSNENDIALRRTKMSFFKATKVEMAALIETLHSYISDSVDVLFNEQLVEFMERVKWAPANGKTIFFDYKVVDNGDGSNENSQRKNTIIFEHFHVAVQKLPPNEGSTSNNNKLSPELVSYSIATDDYRYLERREEIAHEEQFFSAEFTKLIEVTIWPEIQIIFTLRAVVSLLVAIFTVNLFCALVRACFSSKTTLVEQSPNDNTNENSNQAKSVINAANQQQQSSQEDSVLNKSTSAQFAYVAPLSSQNQSNYFENNFISEKINNFVPSRPENNENDSTDDNSFAPKTSVNNNLTDDESTVLLVENLDNSNNQTGTEFPLADEQQE